MTALGQTVTCLRDLKLPAGGARGARGFADPWAPHMKMTIDKGLYYLKRLDGSCKIYIIHETLRFPYSTTNENTLSIITLRLNTCL